MLGQFRLTGSVHQTVKDGVDVDLEQDIVAVPGWSAKLVANYPHDAAIPDGTGITYIDDRTITVLPSGDITEDGVTPGISLTANDDTLFDTPLQWTVKPGWVMLANKRRFKPRSWTFNAPAVDDEVSIGELTPVASEGMTSVARGPKGDPGPEGPPGPGGVAAWSTLTGKPAVIAEGATQAAARAAISAGTSNLTLGTTGSTAKAGDYQPAWTDVTAKPAVIAAGADQAAARTALGATTTGATVFTASNAPAARDAIGASLNRVGHGIVALGDSITANYGASGNLLRIQEGYLSRACAENGQVPMFRGTFATGGFTLAQIQSTHLPTVLALDPKPLACVILGGTNDAGANNGVGFSVTTTLATLDAICESLRGAGIQPILATLPPRGNVTAISQAVSNYNRALVRYASTKGYDVVDYNKVLVNTATGNFLTGLAQSDETHPSFKGVKLMGQALAPVLKAMQKPSIAAPRPSHAADPTNLLGTQGHFLIDTNADGIADGWSNAVPRGATFTVVNDADGVTKWQRITQPSSATGNNTLQKTVNSVVAPGDVIELIARVQTSGFDAALVAPTGTTGGTGPGYTFSATATGAATVYEPIYNWHTDITDGLVYLRGVVPAGATGALSVNLQISAMPVSGSVWAQFAEVCVRNLTTLGLA